MVCSGLGSFVGLKVVGLFKFTMMQHSIEHMRMKSEALWTGGCCGSNGCAVRRGGGLTNAPGRSHPVVISGMRRTSVRGNNAAIICQDGVDDGEGDVHLGWAEGVHLLDRGWDRTRPS